MDIKEIMSKMSVSIMKGLNEEEAAILAGVSSAKYKELKKTSQTFSEFLLKKQIQFKEKHLKIIDQKEDPKTSQWLLEKLRAKEFGSSRTNQPTNINIIGAIIKEVQDGNNQTLIKDGAGILSGTGEGKERKELPKSIEEVLS